MFKYLKWFSDYVLFDMPSFKFSNEWDNMLNEFIDKGKVTYVGSCTITFHFNNDKYCVWVGNPYSHYGYLDAKNGEPITREHHRRPKMSTILKLEKLHTELLNEKHEKQFNNIYKNS